MIYAPAEDSQLLLECVKRYSGKSALEIGVGSCFITEALLTRFSVVAGSDIDMDSLRYCRRHGVKAHLACCDSASAFRGEFDLIVSNPPYLPSGAGPESSARALKTPSNRHVSKPDIAVEGGLKGTELTFRFIQSAIPLLKPTGAILIVVSSHADLPGLDAELGRLRMSSTTVAEKRLFFEVIAVREIRPRSKPDAM